MSFLIHHSLIGSALALITAGTLIGFWNRDPTLNMFGSAVFMLGMTINGLGLIATDVPIDSWSTGDWIACVALAMSLGRKMASGLPGTFFGLPTTVAVL